MYLYTHRGKICYSYELDKNTDELTTGDTSDDDSCVGIKFKSDKYPREVDI